MLKIPGLVILDIKGLLLHSYFRGKDPDAVLDASGTPINTSGFGLRTFIDGYLRGILQEFAPLSIIAVWDGGTDYRTSIFPDYKIKRKAREKNEAQEVQLADLYKKTKVLLAYIGAHNVIVPGTEADDVIGALCKRVKGVPKLVYTVDGDLVQLTADDCVVLLKGEVTTENEGQPHHLVRLYKSMVGDTSDEYGGVPQIGPKAFQFLLDTYELDGMQELEACVKANDFSYLKMAVEATGCKVLNKLYENRGIWRTMYLLADLHPELIHRATAREIIKPEWYVRMADAERVKQVLQSAGAMYMFDVFEPHLPRFTLVEEQDVPTALDHFRKVLCETPFVPFDYESYDALGKDWKAALPDTAKGDFVDVLSQRLTGGSFCYGANLQHTIYVPVQHRDTANAPRDTLAQFLTLIETAELDYVAHNARFEEQLSKQDLNFQLEGPICTQVLASYVDENQFAGLKDQSNLYFHYEQTKFKDLLEKHNAKDMRDLSGQEVLAYGCDDSYVSGRLFMLQFLTLNLEEQWDFAYYRDRFTCHAFNRSFEAGMKIDYEEMDRLKAADQITIDTNMIRIRELLAENCRVQNEAGAMELKRAEGEAQIRLHMAKELNRAQATAKLAESVIRWTEASVYVPFSSTHRPEEFMPTAKGFSRCAELVGIKTPLEKLSAAGLTEWMIAIKDDLSAEGVDPRADVLVTLLAECGMTEFKARSGSAFDALKQYVEANILHESGKVIETGCELNFGSPKQMTELFYCMLALPVRIRTFPDRGSQRDKLGLEGTPSTNEETVMAALAEDCPEGDWRRELLQKFLEVKECQTRFSLYYKKYPHWQHPRDGVVHPGTRNCGTVTRRPAGSNLNVLAVSKGPLRGIFIPRFPSHVSVSLDFSGQELRITGSEAKDPVLIEAYTGLPNYIDEDGMTRANFRDIHAMTGCTFASHVLEQELGKRVLDELIWSETGTLDYELFCNLLDRKNSVYERFEVIGDKLQKVVVKVRKMAKTVNFLIIYGGQAFSMGMKLGIPEKAAQKIIDGVFAGYPRLGAWQQETIKEGRTQGYITTAFGTRKHCDVNILSREGSLRARAERQTVNHKIQGGAADVLKVVLTNAHHTRLYEETHAILNAPVYDELTNSVPIDNVFEFVERAQDIMNITPPGHAIPMLAEVSIGRNWHEVASNELHDRPSQRKIEGLFDKWYAEGWRR